MNVKQASRIFLSILLSVIILFVGKGVDFVRCVHSGTVKVVTCLQDGVSHEGRGCNMPDCMNVGHAELSPTSMLPTAGCDFQLVQPLLAVLPCLMAVLPPVESAVQEVLSVKYVRRAPPRSYLRLLRVLLI